jgi:hypothetical protein
VRKTPDDRDFEVPEHVMNVLDGRTKKEPYKKQTPVNL